MESGQQFFHIVGAEIAEAIVLEIDEEDIVPAGPARAEEILDQLIEEIGFAGPAGADDGKDRPREAARSGKGRSRGVKVGSSAPWTHSAITLGRMSPFIIVYPDKQYSV